MSDPPGLPDLGGGLATTIVLGASAAVFGLLGGLPDFAGPIVGVVGVGVATFWRAHDRRRPAALALLPAVLAVAVLALTSPAYPSTELFGGLTGLALLLWIADDPARARGGGRRAAPAIGLIALAVGLTWTIALVAPGQAPEVGVAGGLLAGAFVVLAWLVARPQAVLLPGGAPRPPARNA